MGSVFKYVMDDALAPCGGDVCHYCERSDAPIYTYNGRISDPSRAKNVELALSEPDIHELCANCIASGCVRKHDYSIKEITPTIIAFAADIQRSIEEYYRTPGLCFFQGDVWPMCCGNFAEYVGDHPLPHTKFGDYEVWEPQNSIMTRFQLQDFYPLDKLEVMYTMALFRCITCPRKYWVFQYSGALWPGPI